jgi:hypothetical protein
MTAAQPAIQMEPITREGSIVNDFSITVGTANGSGSQTSNLTIMRALFKMGIPVSGKNLFPLQHSGLAHLVHDPCQQGWFYRQERRAGDRDRDEPGLVRA